METPFKNDMFSMMYQAFLNLYPGKECEIWWQQEIPSRHDGYKTFGECSYCMDGKVYIDISINQTVSEAVESFVHELAHVALGEENPSHDTEWETVKNRIIDEYNKMELDA